MAQGDVAVFEEFAADISNIHDLDADDYRWALVSDTTVALDTATPTLSDFTQCAAGGNYVQVGSAGSATGKAADITYVEAGGDATCDGADVSWAQHASNPTNARWALLVNNTNGNVLVLRVDLGSTFDMTTGDLVFTVPSLFQLQS